MALLKLEFKSPYLHKFVFILEEYQLCKFAFFLILLYFTSMAKIYITSRKYDGCLRRLFKVRCSFCNKAFYRPKCRTQDTNYCSVACYRYSKRSRKRYLVLCATRNLKEFHQKLILNTVLIFVQESAKKNLNLLVELYP